MFSNSSLLFASALVLAAQLATVASQGHNHTGHEDHPCQCEAKEQGWAINCSDSTAMQARGSLPTLLWLGPVVSAGSGDRAPLLAAYAAPVTAAARAASRHASHRNGQGWHWAGTREPVQPHTRTRVGLRYTGAGVCWRAGRLPGRVQ